MPRHPDSSPERKPTKGRHPDYHGRPIDSDSAEERMMTTTKKTTDRSSTVRETNKFIKNERDDTTGGTLFFQVF